MKAGKRKSQNVEQGAPLPLADFLKLEQGEIEENANVITSTKSQLDSAFKRAKSLGIDPQLRRIDAGFAKPSPKSARNPFAKAKGN